MRPPSRPGTLRIVGFPPYSLRRATPGHSPGPCSLRHCLGPVIGAAVLPACLPFPPPAAVHVPCPPAPAPSWLVPGCTIRLGRSRRQPPAEGCLACGRLQHGFKHVMPALPCCYVHEIRCVTHTHNTCTAGKGPRRPPPPRPASSLFPTPSPCSHHRLHRQGNAQRQERRAYAALLEHRRHRRRCGRGAGAASTSPSLSLSLPTSLAAFRRRHQWRWGRAGVFQRHRLHCRVSCTQRCSGQACAWQRSGLPLQARMRSPGLEMRTPI